MSRMQSAVARIEAGEYPQLLTGVQKKFNQLTKKIQQQKQQLQQWQEVALIARQRVNGELIPVSEQLTLQRVRLIEMLHAASLQYKLTHRETSALEILICQLCDLVLYRNLDVEQENTIKHIYEQYAAPVADQLQSTRDEDGKQLIAQQLKDEFGIDIDPDEIDPDYIDLNHPDALFEKIVEQRAANRQQQQKTNKKTARQQPKQQAKQQQQQQAEEQATKSLKQIYQRLVANLHPDREQDEQEKQRKTVLMQRVTQAYEKQDLMELIQIQVEINQQNPLSIRQMADEQLALYNLSLDKYSKQLMSDITEHEIMLGELCRFGPFDRISPKAVIRKLKDDLAFINQQNQMLQQQTARLVDVKAVKAFLRQFI